MSALRRTRFGVSRRDIGAGFVAALLANVLFHPYLFVQVFFTDPAGTLSVFQWDPLTVAALVGTPVVAVLAGTAVWRAVMPDEPTPLRGAGVVTAFASLLGLALAFGLLAGVSELSSGAPLAAVGTFLSLTAIVFLFGGLVTATVVAPVGALVGYGSEWYLARRS